MFDMHNNEIKRSVMHCINMVWLVSVNIMQLELHSRLRICTPFTRIIRVIRAYYVRKTFYAQHTRNMRIYTRIVSH